MIEETPLGDPAEFADADPLGPDVRWANLSPMVAYLVITGLLLTLATWRNLTWAYVVGLLLTLIWMLGFLVARNRTERWFRW